MSFLDWSGTCAVVTGGASGLGAATAERLAADGMKVTLFDLNESAGQFHAAKIGGHFEQVDVSDPASVAKGLEAAAKAFGAPRVLVNCAGIVGASKTVSRGDAHDPHLFETVIKVNLLGSFYCASQAAAMMVGAAPIGTDGARGVIVNTASVAAYDGQIGQVAYAASKGGIVGMTLPMARDLADKGVRVCSVAPGLFLTPMMQDLPEDVQASLGAQVPFPSRLGAPAEYADMVSQITRNPMLNGEVIRLDGAIRMAPRQAMREPVIIAGGGIGGLTLALTLHQIGVPCRILEAAGEMKPQGVGINIQPNAVRELFDLGIDASALDSVGVQAREWALVGLNGKEIYSEPRGIEAGYNWPQYSVHRGAFHMLLYREVLTRLGAEAVRLKSSVKTYQSRADQVDVHLEDGEILHTPMLIGADGIHSAVRARMHPDQPPIHWGGMLMWRGTVRAKPTRTSASFVGLGTHRTRVILYPISGPDSEGLSLMNWIAEVTVDGVKEWPHHGWFRPVELDEFVHNFEAFRYDWLDVPKMLEDADCAFENPMIDRDPVPTWVDGSVALLGDAAHAMYPTGSNGASQAIMDARILGAKFLQHGVTREALRAYDAQLFKPVSELVLRNRGSGPFGLLNLLHDRCGGVFEDIDDVIPKEERAAFMAKYKDAAGFAMSKLNRSKPTIPQGAKPAI